MIPKILKILGGIWNYYFSSENNFGTGTIEGFDHIREVLSKAEVDKQTFILLEEPLHFLPKKILDKEIVDHIILEKIMRSGDSHLIVYCHESRLFIYIFCGERSIELGLLEALKTMFSGRGNTLRSMEHVLTDDYWGNEIFILGELRLEEDRYEFRYKKEANENTEGAICKRSKYVPNKYYLEVSFIYSVLQLVIP